MLPIALGFIILATGIGMLLSALYVRFRDMAPIWDVVFRTMPSVKMNSARPRRVRLE